MDLLSLVNLNATFVSRDGKTPAGNLRKEDFAVFENGELQEISFFSAADVPFDLILLLDLSGSTSDKRKLIKKTTRRFIEAARPSDKIAIVTFADQTNVVSELTENRERLFKSLEQIDDRGGGSKVWDALAFTLEKNVPPKNSQRRSAIVVLSDGVDGALPSLYASGSKTSFSDLLESVRRNETLVIPIYLDTESGYRYEGMKKAYRHARKTLALVAEESGGLFYSAKKLEDLEGIYEQITGELGRVYSLGYEPKNEKRDGSWRSVKIEVVDRPSLSIRAKSGYYSN